MAERVVRANGVDLCVEAFGEPQDTAVLLMQGVGASMLWWEEPFCRSLAGRGRHVIRYDNRDTGRSVTSEPGRPEYTGGDLVADAVGVLDALAVERAQLVGVSAGGAFAQLLALDRPDRVEGLVLITTTAALSLDRELPPPTDEFLRFASGFSVDWEDEASVIEGQVAYARLLAGGVRPFDEAAMRDLVRRDVERATDIAALQNHDQIADDGRERPPLSSIAAPTVVIHGSADPMFPLAHGEALAEEIPGAHLLVLEGAGHGLDRTDWPTVLDAITGQAAGA
ncbi:MAG: alpha/beta hydrolase [Acidimicrobiales bacterium]|nr:alpha/beta hydrolase [Acidimicrobiales bacterium]